MQMGGGSPLQAQTVAMVARWIIKAILVLLPVRAVVWDMCILGDMLQDPGGAAWFQPDQASGELYSQGSYLRTPGERGELFLAGAFSPVLLHRIPRRHPIGR